MSSRSPGRGETRPKAPFVTTTAGAAATHSLGHAPRLASSARSRWLGVLVAAVTAVTFLPVIANGWVDRDDTTNFLDNPSYRGIGWAQFRWAFSTIYLGVYQPVGWVLLGAQYELCGLMPWGYHLASLTLHSANAVVLMALSSGILKRCRRLHATEADDERPRNFAAAAAALLFAVHPLRVEVVAWASSQPYLPCALFAMLAVLAYLRRDGASAAGRAGWLATAWALYVASLLCKAASLTLPAGLLVLDAFPLRRFSVPGRPRAAAILVAVLEKVPFAAVGSLFVALTIGGKYVADQAIVSENSLGFGRRLARAAYSVAFYAKDTVWPSGLSAIYEWSGQVSVADARFAGAALGTVAVTLIAAGLARRRPGAAAAWFAYLVLLAPVAGFVRSGYAVVADRYAYIATIPLFIALSFVLASPRLAATRRSPIAIVARLTLVAAILGLSAASWRLSRTWRDTDSLFARAAGSGGLSQPTYLIELGTRHERLRQFVEAESCFRQAMKLDPARADVATSLGAYFARRGRLDEAMGCFERSLQIDPHYAVAYNDLGLALAQQGRVNEAAERFETALSLQPYYVEARLNFASLLRHQQKWSAAAQHYALVLRTDPDNRHARSGIEAIGAQNDRLEPP